MKKQVKKVLSGIVLLSMFIRPVTAYALPPEHIIDGYEPYEPLFVHTPVISPVSIKDEDGNDIPGNGFGSTQHVGENPTAWYQLRLDEDYIMHWDALTHREILGYGDSGEDPSKYDKYTQDKWMKFPFEVLYDGVFYEIDGTGYTDWIQIRRPAHWTDTVDNHWIETPIYIPSYAREMGEAGNEGSIYYKVEAINVDGDMAEHFEETEAEGNIWANFVLADDGAKYVATYEIPVQLSGWIYDFTITGSTNGSLYAGESILGSNEIAFSLTKSEKKSGTKNRKQGNVLRYLLDGTITDSWDKKNTITLTDGKSAQYKKQGAVWKGQTFSFEVKTIANLWNDNGNMDRLEIIPTFTYVDNYGNKVSHDHIKVFYDNPDGSGTYIEYGTSRDTISTNWVASKIGTKMQEGAYYTDEVTDTENGGSARKYHFGNWAQFTADEYNANHGSTLTAENILNRTSSKTYCLSHIILNPTLRLLSGEWEQLHWNIEDYGKEYENVIRYSDLDGDGSEDADWDADDTKRFRRSMQTWYGQYYVPTNLYVVDLNKHPGFDMQDYMTHANGGMGIQEDDPVFEKSGYLIVNFDIRTYNEGKAHLKYLGGASGGNMWDEEDFSNTPDPDDPTPIPDYDDGDVIVIDLEKSVKDKYSAGIYNIN